MELIVKKIWKDIPKYDGLYQVSDLGEIKSLMFNKERLLKPILNGKICKKYLAVNLYKNGKSKRINIHTLVAMAFLNHVPSGMVIVVDHINNNHLDNRVENLQLITQSKNMEKSIDKTKTSSRYTGINWDKCSKKWKVQVRYNKKQKHIGLFENEIDALHSLQKALKNLNIK